MAEQGSEKASSEDSVFDFGVRVIAGSGLSAAGYCGQVLGSSDVGRIESAVWEGIRQAHRRARANGGSKGAPGIGLAPWGLVWQMLTWPRCP